MEIISIKKYRVEEVEVGGFDSTEISIETDDGDELSFSLFDSTDLVMISYMTGAHLRFDQVTRFNKDIWRAAWRKFRRLRRAM